MIPTLLIVGFVAGLLGRRGFWAAPIAAVSWATLLVATDVDGGVVFWIAAAALGAVNAAAGVAVGYSLHRILDRGTRRRASPSTWAVEQTRGP